jgi:hypothetical protein
MPRRLWTSRRRWPDGFIWFFCPDRLTGDAGVLLFKEHTETEGTMKPTTPLMNATLDNMLHAEVRCVNMPGACSNLEQSSVPAGTMKGLIARGLVEEATCRIDWETQEIRLTSAGRKHALGEK